MRFQLASPAFLPRSTADSAREQRNVLSSMTLKEELEILRGEPIEVFNGDPMEIPCIETSDAERLCKNPVVSVNMITYNHEPYIRQAIEGVMIQKTDFEFELVIGEDASQDKTREICFEYQKKYPDKIRVLWWHENVTKFGGNARRVTAHCRGEFVAFCEGDDYWVDQLKLQKQVDVMRKHPNVGMVFTNGNVCLQKQNEILQWNADKIWHDGLISGYEFMLIHMFGVWREKSALHASTFLLTASVLVRQECLKSATEKYEIFRYELFLGDTTTWLGVASQCDAYYLNNVAVVYNVRDTGLCHSSSGRVYRDALIVRMYYFAEYFKRPFSFLPNRLLFRAYYALLNEWCSDAEHCVKLGFRGFAKRVRTTRYLSCVVSCRQVLPLTCFLWILNSTKIKIAGRYFKYIANNRHMPKWLKKEYTRLGVTYFDNKRRSF